MLRLKSVSKFYYSNGVIASGFSRVSLELSMGEFVVITGESGSGKSTLLNVLSGLDTYEEGEMYVNGEETSHYNESDFEEYRRKYVGNIFQNFNLVNSYTVYENVELALLLNGERRAEARPKALDIIARVGLSDFRNTKCAKLSGGQKQRVAIARALAKETPIIVADEPTGNLDSKAAAEVVELLSEVAKDKLVIIVTHNLEQVERYATRLIKMHDGKILEDKVLAPPPAEKPEHERKFSDITVAGRLRLGARNAFNVPAKFALIFAVFLFIAFAVAGTYSGFQKMAYEESLYGANYFFNDYSENRIVITKEDRSPISAEELKAVAAMDDVERIAVDDRLSDYSASIQDEEGEFWYYGSFRDSADFVGELAAGRMPEGEGEIVVYGSAGDEYFVDDVDEIIGREFYLENYDMNGEFLPGEPMTVVGVALDPEGGLAMDNIFYAGSDVCEAIAEKLAAEDSALRSYFAGEWYYSSSYDPAFRLEPSAMVPQGQAYVSSALNDMTEDGNCLGEELTVCGEDVYRRTELKLTIGKTYNKNNFRSLLGGEFDEDQSGVIYVNEEQYHELTGEEIYQSSVYAADVKELDQTIEELQAMGFATLALRDARSADGTEIIQIINLLKAFVLSVLVIALFFISYFIIRVVLKSRNAYYVTLRTLGASRRIAGRLLDIELFITASLAYALFLAFMLLVYAGVITWDFAAGMADFLTAGNYAFIYLIMLATSWLISRRFARKLFRDSVMNAYREEA